MSSTGKRLRHAGTQSHHMSDLELAQNLMKTCYMLYSLTPTGLAPELVHFIDGSQGKPERGRKDSLKHTAHDLSSKVISESVHLSEVFVPLICTSPSPLVRHMLFTMKLLFQILVLGADCHRWWPFLYQAARLSQSPSPGNCRVTSDTMAGDRKYNIPGLGLADF